MFQERGFSKQELDQICYSLSPDVWINPHKSLLGLGNYDINVIMAALQRRGREAVWFDKRRSVHSQIIVKNYNCKHNFYWYNSFCLRDPKCLRLDNIEGFILNVPTEYKLGFVLLPLKRRHWIALKKIHGAFYNLDSKLDSPQLIGKVIKSNLPKDVKYFPYILSDINCISFLTLGQRFTHISKGSDR